MARIQTSLLLLCLGLCFASACGDPCKGELAFLQDADHDGISACDDCDDNNAAIYPGAMEISYDGIDQDCSGTDIQDVDEDGYPSSEAEGGHDCDDNNDAIYPGAEELCDGVDNDCDGSPDEILTWYPDSDGDEFGVVGEGQESCSRPPQYSERSDDCNDEDPAIHPGAEELCDRVDNDCDGGVDEDLIRLDAGEYWDVDCDSFGEDRKDSSDNCKSAAESLCVDPQQSRARYRGDCDDLDESRYPGAEDSPGDGVDADCGGTSGPDAYIRAGCLDDDGDNCFITLQAALQHIVTGESIPETSTRAAPAKLAGEADPPPHRPRHADSPSSRSDGPRAPAARVLLPRKSSRDATISDVGSTERVVWLFSSPVDEDTPIRWEVPVGLHRLSLRSILAPFESQSPTIPPLQDFNGPLPHTSCDEELTIGALHFVREEPEATQCSNGPYDEALEDGEGRGDCPTVILDGLRLHVAVGAEQITLILRDSIVEPGAFSTHPSPRVGCGASLTLENTLIQNQTGYQDKGAVYARNSTFCAVNSTLRYNGGQGQYVGAVTLEHSTFLIRNTAIHGNFARYTAGLKLSSSDGTISNSYFSGNTSHPDDQPGVAIHVDSDSHLYLVQSLIYGNATNPTSEMVTPAAVFVEGALYALNSIIEQNNLIDASGMPTCANYQDGYALAVGSGAIFSCPEDGLFLYTQSCDAQGDPVSSSSLVTPESVPTPDCRYLTDTVLASSFVRAQSLDFHLSRSGLRDTGAECPKAWPSPVCELVGPDPDGSDPDFGVFGGPAADDFDLDGDGFPAYYWFGEMADCPESELDSLDAWDSDDADPSVHLLDAESRATE